MSEGPRPILLDGFAIMADAGSFERISQQPLPTDPRIKHLLGKALTAPESLSPNEVQAMAASVVYHLLALKEGVRS